MKNIYFISDAHLGSLAVPHRRMQERRLVRFLDEIKPTAEAIYMLGDMFDFWFEYQTVVPKGFTRFLGKISELTDMGIEVHYFTGNHDIWCLDYLEKECGVTLHRGPLTTEIADKTFFLAHGDGLGDRDWKFGFLRGILKYVNGHSAGFILPSACLSGRIGPSAAALNTPKTATPVPSCHIRARQTSRWSALPSSTCRGTQTSTSSSLATGTLSSTLP